MAGHGRKQRLSKSIQFLDRYHKASVFGSHKKKATYFRYDTNMLIVVYELAKLGEAT
jgi:hypothetical protein